MVVVSSFYFARSLRPRLHIHPTFSEAGQPTILSSLRITINRVLNSSGNRTTYRNIPNRATFKADLKLGYTAYSSLHPLHDTGIQFILRPLENTYFHGGLSSGSINHLVPFHTTILGTKSHSKATTARDYSAPIVQLFTPSGILCSDHLDRK
ncbi:unnamed protein product [Rhizophagus irregularis]|nr:unnamed protein product [Rhizophagus irregularis]